MAKKNSSNKIINWVLIILLFVIIIFIVKYAFNMKTMVKGLEGSEGFYNKPKMTIIYAYSKTCPFCIQFEGIFNAVTKQFANVNDTYEIDIQKIEKKDLNHEYLQHVDGVPTVLIYKGGNFHKKAVGKMSTQSFMKFLETSL